MKAKRYFEKYGKAVYEEYIVLADNDNETCGSDSPLKDLFFDFCKETKDIVQRRRAFKDNACYEVIRQQNQKWNVLCGIFEKEYGKEVLVKDALLTYFANEIPELNNYMNKNGGNK